MLRHSPAKQRAWCAHIAAKKGRSFLVAYLHVVYFRIDIKVGEIIGNLL